MAERACHVIAHGRVQGVFYRASTVRQAQALGISGWVRNCHDGTVEAVLAGPAPAVEEMLRWMARGPRAARVERLAINEHDGDVADGFVTRETVSGRG